MEPLGTASTVERVYAGALRLYPAEFRDRYGEPMRRAFADALDDGSLDRRGLFFITLMDLVTSLCKEHLRMLRETYARPALLFNAFVLAGVATILALALYAIPQQVLRNGANDPQIQMATDLAAKLEAGVTPTAAMPTGDVDMARSLAPFLIVYNDAGQPLGSTGRLDGQIPVLPAGVFDYVRQHGEERVSWQPVLGNTRGVRIAAVVERVNGTQPGFVLAGRSMREVEMRQEQIGRMAGLAWLAMLALIAVGTLGYGWMTRPTRNAPAAMA